ncbi:hypothetical protein CAPTEDRAFT_163423 [Capitella teleta]|uniref:F-actin-capping protein subunit alpha n=1 Tax=Capitella teleta TaxID=283909 RepID=R7TF31_CAPTE|nr:hypothetical protein CAPTEDRAFT_163423 [Capitella teleta]|eukprot:ELT90161.1 hypothetical protein CAPTEDRAFT_163423 [Capitella teleta]
MADSEGVLSDQEKGRIASDFLLHAPPGEFNEVFNDVRILINDDNFLRQHAAAAFAKYNMDQFTPCHLDGNDKPTIITEHGMVEKGGSQFLDPRTKQCFKYDHLRKEASEPRPMETDNVSEPWRKALETALTSYGSEHYCTGVTAVYGSSADGFITLTACLESHKFSPQNFWNGRWRSQWKVVFPESGGTADIEGLFKLQVHYYEDGNVQLVSSKDIKESMKVTNANDLARDVLRFITDSENTYQGAISENYTSMSETTFKALRRILPLTRTKVDWNKILGYSIGSELKNART